MAKTQENREFIRVELAKHPEVFDAGSDEFIGKIIDISTGGFRLTTDIELEEDREYFFKIILPESNQNIKSINVTASVRWSGRETNPERLASGCYLVEIDALGRLGIASLMLNNSKT